MSRVHNYIETLPSETIQEILSYLNGLDLFKCREVCHRWRQEVDGYLNIEAAWRRLCERFLGDSVAAVRARQQAHLPWRQLYESLALWPRAGSGNYKLSVLSSSRFRRVAVLPDGTLGVAVNHRESANPDECFYCDTLLYYCTDTLVEHNRITFDFLFSSYSENEKLIVVVHEDRRICVIPKSTKQHFFVGSVPMSLNVPNDVFSLLDNEVYFQTDDGRTHVSCLIEDGDQATMRTMAIAGHPREEVVAFSRKDKNVYLLTKSGNVHLIHKRKLDYKRNLNKFQSNISAELAHFGFKWSNRVISRWIPNHFKKFLWKGQNNATFCSQGRLALMGTTSGAIHFFYLPTLHCLKVSKANSFFTICLAKILNMRAPQEKILQLDVVEKLQGHKIIVSTVGRVMVLEVNLGPQYPLNRQALTRMSPCPPLPLASLCVCHSSAAADEARPLVLSANARTPEMIGFMISRTPAHILTQDFVVRVLDNALSEAITQTRRELGHSLGKRALRRGSEQRSAPCTKRARGDRCETEHDMPRTAPRFSARLAARASRE